MLTDEQLVLRAKCERSLLFFARYIYKENTGVKFKQYEHLVYIASILHEIYQLKHRRVIFNIPPRYGKTELVIKLFIAWCLAKKDTSKFIHLSYSDSLALDNSSKTKEYIESDAFQSLWGMKLKQDAKSKSKWYNTKGGGVYATSAGGAITGFGAGGSDETIFDGAILIDDPLKPDDAQSEIKRNTVNERYDTTIKSRVNNRNVPIIVIMQRLHENDFTGFLLDKEDENWLHISLPAITDDNKPLCPDKHTLPELEVMRQSNQYVFAGQYMQQPAPPEGGEWKKDWFGIINLHNLPKGLKFEAFIDGAYTKNTQNDPTGIEVIGSGDGNMYILSAVDKYMTLPELKKFIPNYYKSLPQYNEKPLNVSITLIEPKASGKSLKQVLRSELKMNVAEIKTDFVNQSKIECARTASPYIEGGRVYLVKGSWNSHYLSQVGTFPNALHDEHVDLTSYAIERYFIKGSNFDFR